MTAPAPCVVCGESDQFDPTLDILARCRACGFVTWRGEQPEQELYDERYFAGVDYPDYLGNEAALRRSMRRHLEQMFRHAPQRGSLLEIGCAYGFFLDEARRHFRRVVGLDIAAGPAAAAHQRFQVETVAGDFLRLPFDEQVFDVICMWDTIEHLARPDLFIAKARRLLRPGGHLFLTTGDISSFNARRRGAAWRQIHPPSHVHYFSRQSIARLLGRHGFSPIGFETAAYYHSMHNVLGTLALRGGVGGKVSAAALRVIGAERARRIGFWINLGDIMFVAARAV